MDVTVKINVNGQEHTITTDSQRPLLEILREDLGLTGVKYGCGEGQCGACSVLMNGEIVRSCITTASEADGASIMTIEGLSVGDKLHPVQQAFIDQDAIQCGFCTGGMILNAVALLKSNPNPTDQEIIDGMNGNICRCNGYTKILKAVRSAADRMRR